MTSLYGREKAEILKTIYKNVKLIKISKGEKRIHSDSIVSELEIQKLITSAKPKLKLIIQFLSSSGCRISEVFNIRLNDIRVDNDICKILVIGKGQKARTVIMRRHLIKEIKKTFNGRQYLFETVHGNQYDKSNITKQISKLSERVIGSHKTAHSFRHSFCTRMIEKTRKIQAVSEYVGHSSVGITLDMYTHESLSVEELLAG